MNRASADPRRWRPDPPDPCKVSSSRRIRSCSACSSLASLKTTTTPLAFQPPQQRRGRVRNRADRPVLARERFSSSEGLPIWRDPQQRAVRPQGAAIRPHAGNGRCRESVCHAARPQSTEDRSAAEFRTRLDLRRPRRAPLTIVSISVERKCSASVRPVASVTTTPTPITRRRPPRGSSWPASAGDPASTPAYDQPPG